MSAKILITDNFAELRAGGGHYVDKTGFLVDFLRNDAHPDRFDSPKASAVLFARPRHFGKSLFMSMLASFFDMDRDSRELFAGLKVAAHERLCEEWMNRHPVIFCSFRETKRPTYARTLEAINRRIGSICWNHRYLLTSERVLNKHKVKIGKYMAEEPDEDALLGALRVLSAALAAYHGKRTILLVDEYDDLLQGGLEYGYYDEMLSFLRTFLSTGMKTNYDNVRFAVLAGVLCPPRGCFSGALNNLRWYDMDAGSFDDLFGFTQDEVDALLAAVGAEEERDVVREWYGGYRFGRRSDIHNPWSTMKYLRNLKKRLPEPPRSFWLEPGQRRFPKDHVHRLPIEEHIPGRIASLHAGNGVAAALDRAASHEDVFTSSDSFFSFLHLTGFLTRSDDPSRFPEGMAAGQDVLVVPNREMGYEFRKEVETWARAVFPDKEERAWLYDALWKRNESELEKFLNRLLARFGLHCSKEDHFLGIVKGVFEMGYPETTSSGQAARGIHDLLVLDRTRSRAALLEFGRASSEEELEACAGECLKRIADREANRDAGRDADCDRDARAAADGCRTMLHVGVAFSRLKTRVLFQDARPGRRRSGRHIQPR